MSRVSSRFRLAKVRFYSEDLDALARYFPRTGYNRVVRELVHSFLRKLEDQTARRLGPDQVVRAAQELELPADFLGGVPNDPPPEP